MEPNQQFWANYQCRLIPNSPNSLQTVLVGLHEAFSQNANTFIDRTGRPVEIPRKQSNRKVEPYFDDGYAKALWDFRIGSLMLGEDGKTLYVRDVDLSGNNQLLDSWHAISNLESEYHVASRRAYYPWNDQMKVECSRRQERVRHGVKFADCAFIRIDGEIKRIDENHPLFRQPFELSVPAEYSKTLASQAVGILNDVTMEESSSHNLARMFATPLLEPYKHLTFVIYGDGGNGKGIILNALSRSFPGQAVSVDSQKILGGKRGSGGFDTQQETGKLIGALWAYDDDADSIGIDQLTYLKKISTGDSVTARRIQENATSFTPKCTFIIATNNPVITTMTNAIMRRFVYVRMRDNRRPEEFQSMLSFLREHGAAPFLMASCMEWMLHGDDPRDDVSIGDSTDVTDWEQDIIDSICEYGMAPTRMLVDQHLGRKGERDFIAQFGLQRSTSPMWVPHMKTQARVLTVKSEVRFAPYRKAWKKAMAKILTTLPVVPDPLDFVGAEMPLPSTFGFECDYVPVDERKRAINWKKLAEDPNVDTSVPPRSPAYAVVPAQGFMVIDMDMSKTDGEDGWTLLNRQVAPYGSEAFPKTYLVETPSGGVHAYYRIPRHLLGVLKNATHMDGIPVDLRVEGKGYVVGAGSHIASGTYALCDIPDGVVVPELSLQLFEWLDGNGYTVQPQQQSSSQGTVQVSLEDAMNQPIGNGSPTGRNGVPDMSPVPEGSRNTTLHDWAYGRYVHHRDNAAQIERDLYQRGRLSGLPDSEIATIWGSILRHVDGGR
ncbi:MAG: bifunctional DNA primase/polymerase [Bifidobacterium tsurumiense]|uniref:bifunctional DNA primase/polymerase n=1 Tax=Bifidobacterium tsurumiense TaxID=356829 RepID=UPI002A8317D1|nr:bifunctional DNA primase/polymerase [Bifidobacterium tsurumiense]MDY4677603.1 bifunctional DNA primase/polymerase [Bifidobacterium tsurumiense]